ncbi:BppU family phage baseplate upper protein [Paraclostridium benzoelyticum]|nr:BppU family phage baseplate upper protein [Paraclostridium benzoelyticum]
MEKTYQFLDIEINKPIYRKLSAVQYDNNSRYILVSAYSNFQPYDLTYATVKIYGIKKDKTVFFNNANILDAVNGKFEIDLTEQCLACDGDVEIQIIILGANKERLSSNSFILNVKKNIIDPVKVTSQDEWKILTEGLESLAEYDVYKNNVDRHDKEISILNTKNDSIEINVKFPPQGWRIEGLKGNNDEDDTLRLKNIIVKIKELDLKATLRFPSGNYLFNDTIVIPNGVNIKGNGRNETLIKKGNFYGCLFHINKGGVENNVKSYNFVIQDLTLFSQNSYQEGGALIIESCPRAMLKNILIESFNGNGITFFGICFYTNLDSVFIHYCSSSQTGRYLKTDTLPSVDNAGFNGANLRCGIIDFCADGFNSREGNWATATADLTTINCNFEANDVGVRWKSADCHFVSSVFQGNSKHDFISEGSSNFTECHFETDDILNYKTSSYPLLVKHGSVHLNNVNMWGNGVENSISSIKVQDGYYININGGRNLGFKYCIDSDSLARLYSIGNDFTSKDNSDYINGSVSNKIIINSSVGGFLLDDKLVIGSNNKIVGDLIPIKNNSMNIGENDKKTNNIYNTFLFSEKIFLSNQVTLSYNPNDPNGIVRASKGSLCLTPLGLYVREGGLYDDTIWIKK